VNREAACNARSRESASGQPEYLVLLFPAWDSPLLQNRSKYGMVKPDSNIKRQAAEPLGAVSTQLMQDDIMPANKVSPSLQGCRVALTVSVDDPYSPANELREREASLLFYPTAQTMPPDSYDELDAALQHCQRGDVQWLLLATPRAVEAVAERMKHLGIAPSAFPEVRLALYGAMTRIVASRLLPEWQSSLPHFNSHQQLINAMALGAGNSVVVPLPQHSRADWLKLLSNQGAQVAAVPAYRLLLGRGGDDLPGLLWGGLVDAIVFLTENSVRHFVIRLKIEGGTPDMLGDVVVACLDPQSAEAAQAFGLKAQVVPEQYDFAALAAALAQHFTVQRVTA
jgi:uroporphyrinogen-III synthase